MSDAQDRRGWEPAGPVARAYGLSQEPVSVCVGPTGGGKTTESCRRTFRIALWQHPSPRDGIRKGRTIVVAPTYRRIWDQVLPSYFKEINRGWGEFRGARGDPADHVYDADYPGIGRVHVEVLFRAVGDMDLEEFYRGLEATAFWYPEMDTHETGDILSLGANRAGRYPEPNDRPEPDAGLPDAYKGVFGDANAPTIGSWFHRRFWLERKGGDRLFLQPPGYDPDTENGFHPSAENQHNLRKISKSYYRDMAARLEAWDTERLLRNRPGYSRHGQPVHPHFDSVRMVPTRDIEPDPSVELAIGIDVGSNTLWHAAAFGQKVYSGQTRILAEVAPDHQTDIVEFGTEVRRLKDTRFAACKRCVIYADPAARGQSAMKKGVTWAQVLQQVTGIEVRLAPSQDPTVRRTALDTQMKRSGGPGEPGFLVDKSCLTIIEALAGGYRFSRRGDKVSPTPEKNRFSHPAEATQYLELGLAGPGAVAGGFIHGSGAGPTVEAQRPVFDD